MRNKKQHRYSIKRLAEYTPAAKPFFALLLAGLLTAGLLAPTASAAGSGEPVSVAIGTGIPASPNAAVEVPWDDAWFAENAFIYRHGLAVASMALSGAAYLETGAEEALGAMGFDRIKSCHYQNFGGLDGDTAAFSLAVKTLETREGGSIELIAAVIRGTGEAMEWTSNLNVGTGGKHEGFSKAREELSAHLTQYLSELHPADGTAAPVKFLITGHSRGGAVANLTAAWLAESGLADPANIYVYTFAAPMVSTEAAREGYENIFNIVREDDLVTLAPLAEWGYSRYGIDLPLPVETSAGGRYSGLFEKMDQKFAALTGQHYVSYQNAKAPQKITSAIYRLVPSTSSMDMEMLSALLTGDLDGLSAMIHANGPAALILGRRALALSVVVTPALRQERDAIVCAHCMAGYYSWLTSLETEEEIAEFAGVKF